MAKSILAGAKSEKYKTIGESEVNNILTSRFSIDPDTGLDEKEFKIIQKVVEKGRLSSTAVANLIKLPLKDTRLQYIEPLRASGWLAIASQGVIPGELAHKNYRKFIRRVG